MNSWRECKLGEIATYRTGKLNSNASTENGKYPFFTCSPITAKIDNYAFDEEALLLAGNNANGIFSLKYYKGKFNAYQRTYLINTKEDYKFLFYCLKLQLANLVHISQGTATKFLTLPILNNIDISLPPLEEQKTIAEVLSSLDDKIDLLHRQNKTLEDLAGTLFRQWFIEEAKEEWEMKFSDAPIQLIDGDRGNNYPKNSDFFTNEYCLFLSAKNVTKNGFEFVDCSFITKKRDELLRKGKLSRHDVVLTTRGTVGNIAYYHKLIPFENIRINSGMVILRADETKISSLYLYIFMKSPLFSESVIEHTSGSAQPQIPIRDLNNVSFILPPEDIYNKFIEQVEPIYFKVFSNQQQIQILENLRDTLLLKLLSGEVRVKNE